MHTTMVITGAQRSVTLLAGFAALSAHAEDFATRTFKANDGDTLLYRLLQPAHYDPAQKYPLVLHLHGGGSRGVDNLAQIKNCLSVFAHPANREKYPCFVMVPQGRRDEQWADSDWRSFAEPELLPWLFAQKRGALPAAR